MTRAISGISASAWPRTIGSDSCHGHRAVRGVEHGGGAGFKRGIDGENAHASSVALNSSTTGLVPAIHAFTPPQGQV